MPVSTHSSKDYCLADSQSHTWHRYEGCILESMSTSPNSFVLYIYVGTCTSIRRTEMQVFLFISLLALLTCSASCTTEINSLPKKPDAGPQAEVPSNAEGGSSKSSSSTGNSGSGHGSGPSGSWDYNWGWGSAPGNSWGYGSGSGSSESPSGSGHGFGFGYGSGSSSGSAAGYGFGGSRGGYGDSNGASRGAHGFGYGYGGGDPGFWRQRFWWFGGDDGDEFK